jgi:hypothetical protein
MDGVVRSLPRRSPGSVYMNTNPVSKRLHTDSKSLVWRWVPVDYTFEAVWLRFMTGRGGRDQTVKLHLKTRSPAPSSLAVTGR